MRVRPSLRGEGRGRDEDGRGVSAGVGTAAETRNIRLMVGPGSQVPEDASPRERAAPWVRFRPERPGSPPSSASVPRGGREWTAALGRGARVAGLT